MTQQHFRQLPDNTPVIIGAGQFVERFQPPAEPPLSSPMQLAAAACRRALHDAGIAARDIDTIAVIKLFSDVAKTWASPFGGSNNPPESVARLLGATPQARIYSNVGGTEPLQVMVELLHAIARGEKKLALLTGAEAIANQRYAVRNGIELDWREAYDTPLDNRDYSKRMASREEIGSGLHLPVHFYALIENIHAHRMRHNLQQHRHYMAQLLAPFSTVAAGNPYAQSPATYSAGELATSGKDNYALCLPYTKRLIAQDAVNQAAALVLTSVGYARKLGVDPRQWVFLEGYAEGMDQYLSLRDDPGRSTAMASVLTSALDRAEASSGDMDLIDIYSCFPCAVSAACDVLGMAADGSGALTVTGGLPFFGGPGNNYSMHALAEVALRLRGQGTRALVTANGGMLSKHAAAVLSTDAARASRLAWGVDDEWTLDCSYIPARTQSLNPNGGTVISYTVIPHRDKASTGIVLAETATGERFLASSTAPEVTGAMALHAPIGRRVQVRSADERHLFDFVSA